MGSPPPRRAWAGRMVVAIAVCLLAFGWLWVSRAGQPSDGTVVYTTSAGWHPDGLVVGIAAGDDSPLRPGDVITDVDGRPLAAGALATRPPRIGDTVLYDVVRDGTRLRVPVTLTNYRFWALVEHHAVALPYLFFLIVLPSMVVARRPRDPAAVSLYAVTVLSLVGFASHWFGTQVIDVATGRLWVTVTAELANAVLWAGLVHFAATFPQPWPILRRRPWLVTVVYAVPFLAYGIDVALRQPQEGLRQTWMLIGISRSAAVLFPVLILAAGLTSYLLAPDPAARRRMRLVSQALGLLAGGYLLLGRLPDLILGHPLVSWDYFSLVCIPAQLLVAAALLRYRLWDIQIILRRSLVYGVVTTALIFIYVVVAAALGAAVDTRLGLVPVLLSVVVAVSFSTARTALRRAVSRLVYGDREEPYEVLRKLGRRLESAGSAEAVLDQLLSTLVRTLRLTHAAIEVPGLALTSSRLGEPSPAATEIDLVHDGERIGRLVLDPGLDREPFGESDRRLLEGLAQHVSATAHGLLLAARLRRSLEKTVTVLEEERRRIRREVHDGLGPTITSASMRLDLGRSLIRTDPAAAEAILADLSAVHHALVRDLRELVDGLRPTILDHLGLAAALRELAERLGAGIRTTVECDTGASRLPAAVEVAAYRIVAEALTNVVRHAQASTCDIRVHLDTDLHIEVRDDGRGLTPAHRRGMGLASISERCAELGGRFELVANVRTGVILRCRLPVTAP